MLRQRLAAFLDLPNRDQLPEVFKLFSGAKAPIDADQEPKWVQRSPGNQNTTELCLYIWRWRSRISAEAKNMAEQATYSHVVSKWH